MASLQNSEDLVSLGGTPIQPQLTVLEEQLLFLIRACSLQPLLVAIRPTSFLYICYLFVPLSIHKLDITSCFRWESIRLGSLSDFCSMLGLCTVLGEGRGSHPLSMVWKENRFGKPAGLVLLRFSNFPVRQNHRSKIKNAAFQSYPSPQSALTGLRLRKWAQESVCKKNPPFFLLCYPQSHDSEADGPGNTLWEHWVICNIPGGIYTLDLYLGW